MRPVLLSDTVHTDSFFCIIIIIKYLYSAINIRMISSALQ